MSYTLSVYFWERLCTPKRIRHPFWLDYKQRISMLHYYCQCVHIMQTRVHKLTRRLLCSWSCTRLILGMSAVLVCTSWIISYCGLVKPCTLALMNHMHTYLEVGHDYSSCSIFDFVKIGKTNSWTWESKLCMQFRILCDEEMQNLCMSPSVIGLEKYRLLWHLCSFHALWYIKTLVKPTNTKVCSPCILSIT
jgi:hypothetical protein